MVFLFLGTTLLAGPIWCSYLCYLGAWDNSLALTKRHSRRFPKWGSKIRWLNLFLMVLFALGLRMAGAGPALASVLAIVFGLTGVAVMVFVSRKKGYLAHCTLFCPLGSLAVLLGRLNPMRVRINRQTCDECMACVPSCRYGALNADLIRRRKVGINCTLCGDCMTSCPHHSLEYYFPGLGLKGSKVLFVVTMVTLHSTFLAFARI